MISHGNLFPFEKLNDVKNGESQGAVVQNTKEQKKKESNDATYISDSSNWGINYQHQPYDWMDDEIIDIAEPMVENGSEIEQMKEGMNEKKKRGDEVKPRHPKSILKKMKKMKESMNSNNEEQDEDETSTNKTDKTDKKSPSSTKTETTTKTEKVKDTVAFWGEDPNVLFSPKYIFELFPVESMTYNQKLNSVSRLIIGLTLVGFLFVRNMRIIWIGAVCLLSIFLLQYSQTKSLKSLISEGFDERLESLGVDDTAQAVIKAFASDDPSKIGKRVFFDTPKINNPYNNVLVTDIVDNPNKLPAPPAYYEETEKEILDKTKEAIQKMNPTFPNITDKLFASLDDHFEFEQSARQFYSNPSTTIPNDQGAFAEFCYGEMISCKEGNMFACARDAPRHNLY